MAMLYPNLSYNKVFYKGTALFFCCFIVNLCKGFSIICSQGLIKVKQLVPKKGWRIGAHVKTSV